MKPATRVLPLLLVTSLGCSRSSNAPQSPAPTPKPGVVATRTDASTDGSTRVAQSRFDQLPRAVFNRVAVQLNLPLYWEQDTQNPGTVDPDEVVTLQFYPTEERWVENHQWTPAFTKAYARMLAAVADPTMGLTVSKPEETRRKLVLADLEQGVATLVRNDFRSASEIDQKFVAKMLDVAHAIDVLFEKQTGVAQYRTMVPDEDLASQSLFRRNRGPRCRGPKTEKDKLCSAVPGVPHPAHDGYPHEWQTGDSTEFCTRLEKDPKAAQWIAPFVVVRETKPNELTAVPYNVAYKDEMESVAKLLDEAAATRNEPEDSTLKTYLLAAATSFRTNDWVPADRAWVQMNASNSRWFVRVGPDETYNDPCSHKAGFHLTFAKINQASVNWQTRLAPLRRDMELAVASAIGAAYKARPVDFHIPDFIDIVVNAGDDRTPFGATVGQSLPNWGPVAESGGRTVVMSNLYTDPDSRVAHQALAASLLVSSSLAAVPKDNDADQIGTILHEATHNLGPAHEYRVNGKTDEQLFGGGLASTFEELKAQTGALYFLPFLKQRGLLTQAQVEASYTESVVWAFGHISRGMTTESGQRKPYSQLAAIQVGYLIQEGALVYNASAGAANKKDIGAFELHFDKFEAAVQKLMHEVGDIKARGDRAAAEALAARFVDGTIVPFAVITERMLREPKTSFVYAVDLNRPEASTPTAAPPSPAN